MWKKITYCWMELVMAKSHYPVLWYINHYQKSYTTSIPQKMGILLGRETAVLTVNSSSIELATEWYGRCIQDCVQNDNLQLEPGTATCDSSPSMGLTSGMIIHYDKEREEDDNLCQSAPSDVPKK